MAEPIIMAIDTKRLSEIIQAMGFRAEPFDDANGTPCIRSATGGVAFTIRFGNRAPPPAEGHTDFTFIALIQVVEGEFPLERVNEWNQQRRFCKLHRREGFLVLDLDVIVAGGVSEGYLRSACGLWDRLVQDFVLFLRGELPVDAGQAA